MQFLTWVNRAASVRYASGPIMKGRMASGISNVEHRISNVEVNMRIADFVTLSGLKQFTVLMPDVSRS